MPALVKAPKTKPIQIGLYTLTETGLEIDGAPDWKQHEAVGEFIRRAHKASSWWVADWIAYGETRPDWQQRLEQVVDATAYSERTLKNIKRIGECVTPARRRDDLDFSLHAEVAPLEPEDQVTWLEKAAVEGWSQRDLRRHIRAWKRTAIVEGQAALEGMFRVIYADCPWLYGDSDAPADGSLGKHAHHFPGMTIDELCKLPVEAHALPDAVLFFWVTAPMLYENPGPREVIEAWGFKPKTGIVWDKVLHNWGHYVGIHHEHLIIATRGSCMPDNPTPMPDSVQVVRREIGAEHSEKPEHFRRIITSLYTRGPYLELFGRLPVEGWSVFGNDARLWADQQQALL